ncbi:hypothetical protein CHUAL_008184 [Chamberlinius hualienensis]
MDTYIRVLGYPVKIRKAFGILMNVFGSLKNFGIRVDARSSHKRVVEWIRVCTILYSIIHSLDQPDDVNTDEALINTYESNAFEAEEKRNSLCDWLIK